MKKLVIPIIMTLVGTGVGVGAGIYFVEDSVIDRAEDTSDTVKENSSTEGSASSTDLGSAVSEYVSLSEQFVIPIVKGDRISSMVVMSLDLEVDVGLSDYVFQNEPKIRASMLRILFDHANIGGFDGYFTETQNLEILKSSLLAASNSALGDRIVSDVLIQEMARQDY